MSQIDQQSENMGIKESAHTSSNIGGAPGKIGGRPAGATMVRQASDFEETRSIGGRPVIDGRPVRRTGGKAFTIIENDDDSFQMPEREDITLKGRIKNIIYADKNSPFRIFSIRTEKGEELVCKGNVGDVIRGMDMEFYGIYVQDKKWGKQFKVNECKEQNTVNSMEILLTSIDGIGFVIADKLIDAFGENLPDIVCNHPEKMAEIGITEGKIKKIIAAWPERMKSQGIREILKAAGIGQETIERIILEEEERKKEWLETHSKKPYISLEERIRENPWELTIEESDVELSFVEADRIAKYLKFPMDSPERSQAGIIKALNQAGGSGHCWITESILRKLAEKLLSGVLPETNWNMALNTLILNGTIKHEDEKIFLASLERAERNIANSLTELDIKYDIPDGILEHLPQQYNFRGDKVELNQEQKTAVLNACRNGVSIVTGGPGTGKTATVRSIINVLNYLPSDENGSEEGIIYLCAPTGKAAQRLSELSGYPATTIHRMLGMQGNGRTEYTKLKPLPAKAIILDEASMLDVKIASKLMDVIPKGCRIIFSGDADQLPPVGPGNVLRDMINSQKITTTKLETIYRQNPDSFIATNARAINQGDFSKIEIKNASDFSFVKADTAESCAVQVVKHVKNLMKNDDVDSSDIMVAVPMNTGESGVIALNTVLQNVMNPYGFEIGKSHKHVLRVGDKIIQTKNNYKKMVFNGELGRLIEGDSEKFTCDFGGDKIVEYEADEIQQLALAYAMTIHKSQGSEIDNVVLVVSNSQKYMLDRSLLYTGVTRARKNCIIIGDETSFKYSVEHKEFANRNTCLISYLNEPQPDFGRRMTVAEAIRGEFEKEAGIVSKMKNVFRNFGF